MARSKKRKTPAQAAAKWVATLQGGVAQANYKQNTQGKGGAAMGGAANAVESGRYLQGVQAAVSNGSMVKALQSGMGAALYNTNTQSVGAANLGSGAQKKQPKYLAAITALQPVYDQMAAASAAIGPKGDRGTAAARAAAALAVLMAAGKKAQ